MRSERLIERSRGQVGSFGLAISPHRLVPINPLAKEQQCPIPSASPASGDATLTGSVGAAKLLSDPLSLKTKEVFDTARAEIVRSASLRPVWHLGP